MPDLGALFGGGGLVTLILGAGAGAWRIINRRDTQKDPIRKKDAAMALSTNAVNLMRSVSDDVRKDMAVLRTELVAEREHRRLLEERVDAAESTISHHERLFSAAMSYIERLLRHIRDGKPQPPPPVPNEIRDLIDPSLHD